MVIYYIRKCWTLQFFYFTVETLKREQDITCQKYVKKERKTENNETNSSFFMWNSKGRQVFFHLVQMPYSIISFWKFFLRKSRFSAMDSFVLMSATVNSFLYLLRIMKGTCLVSQMVKNVNNIWGPEIVGSKQWIDMRKIWKL